MKVLGAVFVIGVLLAIAGGFGYGLVAGYGVLSVQWSLLDDEWRAILIVIAAMILLASLFVTYMLGRTIRSESHRSVGRVDAYNEFVTWYSLLKGNEQRLPEISTLAPTKNRMMLWGSNHVVKQINLLHELLEKSNEFDMVLEKAGHVYLEIKRELGHRSPGVDRNIV